MIDPETKRKCRELGVPGLAEAADIVCSDQSYASLTFEERVRVVVGYAHQVR